MNKRIFKLILLIILIIIFYFLYSSGLVDSIRDIHKLKKLIKDTGGFGYLMYILIYVLAAVFSLPASVITMGGGILFGPIKGAILALTGATLGASTAFLIARYLMRDFITKKFCNNPIFIKIERGFEKSGRDFLILTRLVPIFPYNLQNYAYGITNIKFSTYTIISFITMAPGAFIYAYMAGDIVQNGFNKTVFLKLFVAGTILFIISQIPKLLVNKKGLDLGGDDFEA
ncbi:TVP38/TMEM64 family protein [Caloramator sp. CAR-1]|uniref:TVP38/TMEM64 family protein n=1 Tax=Caloramator sp. CAR-1 TaxID=3062777 RepID=UPI0026E38589|nr:TVP38/TMEM64 family protein [Caloramator sp. CAR-1]MDO6354066.1 TVP38/TMEM64 family protein [Caloramator sp. CAR-1]